MDPINVNDYEVLAKACMEPAAWDYYQGGSDDEITLRANRNAYEHIRLRPRVLVDVSSCDLSTSFLGTQVGMPIMIAPTSAHQLAHTEGELATARAAGASNTLMIVSTLSTYSLEEIAKVASGPLWFQLYIYHDLDTTVRLVRRAELAGYRALVLTVDTPRLGKRERDLRNGFSLPKHIRLANFTHDAWKGTLGGERASITWKSLEWLKSLTSLPILLKGILTAEDALLAIEHGVAGIVVSNHGGRQLDSVPASIEVLSEITEAVAGQCEVYVDGGVRRGTDILKALGLGAQAVLIGRPPLWGLAAQGEEGVSHVLNILREELELAMILAGRPTIASIDRSIVRMVLPLPPGPHQLLLYDV